MVTDSATFIITRCAIGFALACFVCCQFWSSCMFSPNVVGTANAFAGGWGNLGACLGCLLTVAEIYSQCSSLANDMNMVSARPAQSVWSPSAVLTTHEPSVADVCSITP